MKWSKTVTVVGAHAEGEVSYSLSSCRLVAVFLLLFRGVRLSVLPACGALIAEY